MAFVNGVSLIWRGVAEGWSGTPKEVGSGNAASLRPTERVLALVGLRGANGALLNGYYDEGAAEGAGGEGFGDNGGGGAGNWADGRAGARIGGVDLRDGFAY